MNLTNFQRIFLTEKDLTQTAGRIGHRNTQTSSSSVFEVIHSLATVDTANIIEINQKESVSPSGSIPSEQQRTSSTTIVYNPLLLSIPGYDETFGNGSYNGNNHNLTSLTGLTDGGFDSSMHIDRIFDDAQGQVILCLKIFFKIMCIEHINYTSDESHDKFNFSAEGS